MEPPELQSYLPPSPEQLAAGGEIFRRAFMHDYVEPRCTPSTTTLCVVSLLESPPRETISAPQAKKICALGPQKQNRSGSFSASQMRLPQLFAIQSQSLEQRMLALVFVMCTQGRCAPCVPTENGPRRCAHFIRVDRENAGRTCENAGRTNLTFRALASDTGMLREHFLLEDKSFR